MRINTNVSSLTAQEAAQNTSKSITSSLEKLSTGFRINKASDDASGLAIADKLRTQGTSINQGIANGNSAVTLLQIADKSMAEQSNILDTIKAKLVQANTDTTSSDGREAIRKDISKLLEQLDNIAKQTNYNGNVLLQSSSTNQNSSKDLSFQIGETNLDIISNKSIQSNTKGLGLAVAEVHTSTITAANSTEYKIEIDGTSVSYTSDASATIDEIHAGLKSAIEANSTLAAKVTVEKQATSGDSSFVIKNNTNNETMFVSTATGIDTSKLASVTTVSSAAAYATTSAYAAHTSTDKVSTLTIDGIDFSATTGDNVSGNGALTDTSTATQVAKELIAKALANTDIAAKYNITESSTGVIKVETKTAGDASAPVISGTAGKPATAVTVTNTAAVKESHQTAITAENNTEYRLRVGNETISYTSDKDATSAEIHTGLKAAIEANKVLNEEYTVTSTASPFKIEARIANTNTGNLTVSTFAANTKLVDAITTSAGTGKSLADLKGLSNLTKVEAGAFQEVVDAAITDLNGYRGDIGSTQNQVESAVRNLMTQSTNVKAAESIIRDVDYAAESANFNKQNIISQAGSYAISQANAVQQNVLRLLQ
jgi:flagellin